jgi:tetratricopeptide (TPR) repeat protein
MEPSYLDRGREQACQGDYQGAIATFSQAIQLNPHLADAYYRRGLAYLKLGSLHEAVFDYTAALNCDRDRMEFYHARAFVRVQLKNLHGALADVQAALNRNFNYAPAHQLKGTIEEKLTMLPASVASFKQAANLYLAAKDSENCRVCLQKIEKLQFSVLKAPELPPPEPSKLLSQPQLLAQILQQAEKGDCTGALQALDWAIKVDDKDAQVYCCRGIVKSKMGDRQGAIADFSHAIQQNPLNAIAFRNRGKLRLQISDFFGASADLNQALQIDPQDAMNYVGRGEVCSAMGNYQDAIIDFSQAINLKPDYPEAYLSRAQAYTHQEEMQKAISDRQIAASQFSAKQDWHNYNKTLAQLRQFQSGSFQGSVSSSTNFAFLQTYEPKLANLATLAEQYYTKDPVTCLMKLRQFGELLAQCIAKKVQLSLIPNEPQLDLLNRLHNTGYLPDDMHRIFQEIRRVGNQAAHDYTGEHRTALKHLKYAREIAIWYCRSFGGDTFFAPDPFIAPPES